MNATISDLFFISPHLPETYRRLFSKALTLNALPSQPPQQNDYLFSLLKKLRKQNVECLLQSGKTVILSGTLSDSFKIP